MSDWGEDTGAGVAGGFDETRNEVPSRCT